MNSAIEDLEPPNRDDEVAMPVGVLVSRNHRLKCWSHWFDEIVSGRKTFDVRSTSDRCFQAGDTLELFRWDPDQPPSVDSRYRTADSGLFVNVIAVYHDLPGVQPGYCVMTIGLHR